MPRVWLGLRDEERKEGKEGEMGQSMGRNEGNERGKCGEILVNIIRLFVIGDAYHVIVSL